MHNWLLQTRNEVLSACKLSVEQMSANSLFIVRLKCNEKVSCELCAASSVFGHDPCKDTYKYLEVKYKCVNLG